MVSRKRNNYRKMKIIDNFLDKEDFLNIKSFITSGHMPWYMGKVLSETSDYQFSHLFYWNFTMNSDQFKLVTPLINKLKIKSILRIKANLLLKSNNIYEHGYHCDFKFKNLKTAVYYCNTNNGYTKFKNGNKIESIENRIVIFNANELHTGSTCTDENFRIVINLNYYD